MALVDFLENRVHVWLDASLWSLELLFDVLCQKHIYVVLLVQSILSLLKMISTYEWSIDHPVFRFRVILDNVEKHFSGTHHHHHLSIELRIAIACSVSELWFEREEHIEVSEPRSFRELCQHKKVMCVHYIDFVSLHEVDVLQFPSCIHNNWCARGSWVKYLAVKAC